MSDLCDREQSIWICKPGEFSNRGNGIKVLPSLAEVQSFIEGTKPGELWVV